ncbi:DUF2199 domain-containing protein [Kribbella sp. NPDC051587]|uniref:DUF2199 domain-containing protein n=1 Tax=Kribbella sp. NPDC051587 TaxID=3364119 RepID=UPI0037A1325D
MAGEMCSCGRPIDEAHRNLRFTLPDPVVELPEGERTPGTWMSHGTARESVMMQVPGAGPFVRALLRIQLEHEHTLTYGVWLAVRPDDLQRTFAVWWEPEYADLRLDGLLANAIHPWGLFGVPVTATVRDPDETPYLTESPDPVMSRVLADTWTHDDVRLSGDV